MAGSDTTPPTDNLPSEKPGNPDSELHAEIERQFSDYLENILPGPNREAMADHLSRCEACSAAYGEFKQTVTALSGLHRMSAPQSFDNAVQETIRRRSGGRFFGRKAFGDRIPFEILAIIALAIGLLIVALLRSSSTGSLHYEEQPETPEFAPGAREAVPQPEPLRR